MKDLLHLKDVPTSSYKILTIFVVEQEDINALSEVQIGEADFIIAIQQI